MVVFTIPGLITLLLSVIPFRIIPQAGVWLIEKGVGNAAWIVYSLGTIALLINLILAPTQVSVRMLLVYVPLVLFSLQQ